jgi:hypothetical protein
VTPRWIVTTAVSAYEQYVVEAPTGLEAQEIVRDPARRSELRSWPYGFGDDEMVIDVKRQPDDERQ